jgi:HD-like signal output (HDOD) protein
MAAYFKEQFTAIIETAARKNVPPWYVEMQYGLTHSQLGKYLASRWALPGALQAVIEFHHAPEKSKYFRKEVRLIYLANVLTHSREHPELADEDIAVSCCRDLYISEEEWQEFREGVESIRPAVDELWNLLK